jgi:glycosyltransferase involved in cell wall biosynthesis
MSQKNQPQASARADAQAPQQPVTPTAARTQPDAIKVSILIPICNVEKYLRQCLDSVCAQTLKEIELICINDGSTDSSLAIIEEYRQRDPRIVIIDKPNSGYGDSMNQGLKTARGKYIGIVESDDWVEEPMFEDLYTLAEQHQAEVVKSNFYHYFSNGNKNIFFELLPPGQYDRVIDPAVEPQIFMRMPAIWAGIYRRDFLEDAGIKFLPTPGASYQDTSFNFKVWAMATRIYLTRQAYLHYRLDNESSSVNSRGKAFFVAEELHEMERFVAERNLGRRLNGIVQERKVDIYFWNLSRLSGENAQDFATLMYQEFSEADDKELFDRSLLSVEDEHKLMRFIDDKDAFVKAEQALSSRQQAKTLLKRILLKISPSYRRQHRILEKVEELTIENDLLLLRLERLQRRLKDTEGARR